MTLKSYYQIIANTLPFFTLSDEENKEMLEITNRLIKQLEKPKEKKKTDYEAHKEQILTSFRLANRTRMSASEIKSENAFFLNTSIQKIVSVLSKMADEGLVTLNFEKRKTYYVLQDSI